MIVAIVRFQSPEPLTVEQAREAFSQSAPSYLDVPGLLHKAYLRSEDGRTVGGVYWWADRESAEAKYNDGWRAGVAEKYGAPPSVEFWDAPVVVDPRNQAIFTSPPIVDTTAN